MLSSTIVFAADCDPLTFAAVATHPLVLHADSITHVSRPPGALSYGWPLGFVTAPKSAANVPLRAPPAGAAFGCCCGLLSFPRSTVRIVATAAIIRTTAMGITTAPRCHHRGGARSGGRGAPLSG